MHAGRKGATGRPWSDHGSSADEHHEPATWETFGPNTLFFRVSATDWLGGDTDDERPGWTVDDTVELAWRVKALGVDLLDVSSGGSAPDAHIPVAPGYQVPFAARIRKQSRSPPRPSD